MSLDADRGLGPGVGCLGEAGFFTFRMILIGLRPGPGGGCVFADLSSPGIGTKGFGAGLLIDFLFDLGFRVGFADT